MTDLTGLPQVCSWPGCERPASPDPHEDWLCTEHSVCWNAKHEIEEWELALSVLRPWMEATRAIGYEKLTEVMERALGEAEASMQRATFDLKRAEAALEA